jgi:tetratricopeptide (TPR) repeat protein
VEGRLAESIGHYRRCLEVQPSFAEVHSNLRGIHASQGLLNEALACYREAVRLQSANADVHSNPGFVQASRGDWHNQGKYDEAKPGVWKRGMEVRCRLHDQACQQAAIGR